MFCSWIVSILHFYVLTLKLVWNLSEHKYNGVFQEASKKWLYRDAEAMQVGAGERCSSLGPSVLFGAASKMLQLYLLPLV